MQDLKLADIDKRLHDALAAVEELKVFRAQYLKLATVGKESSNGNKRSFRAKKKNSRPVSPKRNPPPNSTGLRAVLHSTPLPEFFTVEEGAKALQGVRFNFNGRDPIAAVRDALYVAAKKGRGFRLAKKGNGNEGNSYAKIL